MVILNCDDYVRM